MTAPTVTPPAVNRDTRHALDVDGVVELAVVERNGFIESRHLGAAVVVTADGTTARSLGDADALVFPRSSLKPFQAITVLRSGVSLEGAELVLATASHAGTPEHVEVVSRVLERTGLGEDSLQCPRDWPGDPQAAAVARTSGRQRRTMMNCSGKHAAFLLACVQNGWSTDDYLDPEHPLQVRIRATVEEFTGEPVGPIGVDGCGAPLFAVTLRGLARAFSRLARGVTADSVDPDALRLVDAIRANPWAIEGRGRPNSVVIEELGILCKGGAEGVIAMGCQDGTALALKSLDGSQRVTTLVALELLAQAGAVPRDDATRVISKTTDQVLGGGEPVGSIRAVF